MVGGRFDLKRSSPPVAGFSIDTGASSDGVSTSLGFLLLSVMLSSLDLFPLADEWKQLEASCLGLLIGTAQLFARLIGDAVPVDEQVELGQRFELGIEPSESRPGYP